MGISTLSHSEVVKIKELRKTGHSLGEIKAIVGRGYGTIFRYIKDVEILPEYESQWKVKRGGSRKRAEIEWNKAQAEASVLLGKIGSRDRMIILACLYWGEGNKTELSLINSDPTLVTVFVRCLRDLGVTNDEFKVSLRLFDDIDKKIAADFWQKILELPSGSITKFEIVEGKKVGKLAHGMCRVRVKKAKRHFKLIMSMVDLIRSV